MQKFVQTSLFYPLLKLNVILCQKKLESGKWIDKFSVIQMCKPVIYSCATESMVAKLLKVVCNLVVTKIGIVFQKDNSWVPAVQGKPLEHF